MKPLLPVRLPKPLLLTLLPLLLAAKPYTPPSGETVLLKRPPGARAALATPSPSDAAEAVAAAIRQARKTGDPRYFGQAEALLGPAWTAADPPPRLRLLRATLRQQRHDFAGAISDLDALIAAGQHAAEARLIRAMLALVAGEPQRARADCAALLTQASFLVTASCLGAAKAHSGEAAMGLAAIEQALARDADAPLPIRVWAQTLAAETAERMGATAQAEGHYRSALAAASEGGENDVYLQAAYADFLLQQGRAEAVRALLADKTDFDPLLLRLALAETVPRRAVLAAQMQERFQEGRDRGDIAHHREEAMAALDLQQDAAAALSHARANWQSQREPADALILLRAALASGDKAAALPVRDWQQATGIEDVRLARLWKQWEALP